MTKRRQSSSIIPTTSRPARRAGRRPVRAVLAAGLAGAILTALIGGPAAAAAAPTRAEQTSGQFDLAPARPEPAVVRTDSGPVRGTVAADHRVFQGIPYAAPPEGPLRWQPPQPVTRWVEPRDATRPGPACPQANGFLGDEPSITEDCLYLNVTTPTRRDGRDRPVLLWLHGGGFFSGSGHIYGSQRLATAGDVVVVTVNYRLGVFGFLAHPGLDGPNPDQSSGNYGLQDQQAALRWISRNIAAFGGDPGNVTVAGESAGAVSTCAHLAAPGSAGLFHRAVIQSGPCALTTQWPYLDGGNWVARPRAEAERMATGVLTALGCPVAPDAAAVACLRREDPSSEDSSVERLLAASNGGYGFGPVVGPGVLPVNPVEAIRTGRFNRVPVLHGTTRDEHITFQAALEAMAGGQPTTEESYVAELTGFFGPERAAQVLDRYPVSRYGSAGLAAATVWTDSAWACPARTTNQLLSRHVPTYAFEFADEQAPWFSAAPAPTYPTGAFHAAELQYLFDDEQFPGPQTADQRHLSDQMVRYWARFAHTGNPNGPGLPTWPRMSPASDRVQVLAPGPGGIGQVDLGREHACGFWRS
ncbi:carboxylesterase/lipase family protein [Plantactinospora solaniradicis]|uniref:Carboxylic ester hydrolase n=1 Tax=Plantactinospora solaniradicis TaxID=1723736 RepID=A0ABW1KCF5_9ACTN